MYLGYWAEHPTAGACFIGFPGNHLFNSVSDLKVLREPRVEGSVARAA